VGSEFSEKMVRSLLTFTTIGLTILSLVLSSCRPSTNPQQQSKPSPVAIEPKLQLDELSFEQVDKQGKPLWKVRAEKGIYSPDRKRAQVTNLDGDLYQDGQIVLHVTAKSGEVEQEGEKVFLRGDVITKATKNNLVIVGQEVEWQPKADLLTIRDRVQANHPQFQANAERGQYFSRKQQLELSGKITAFTNEPRLAMQTEQLTWLVKDQQVIGKTATQIQRYQGQQVTATVTANSSTTSLDRKIINLLGNVQLNATKPLIQVNGESFSWDIDRELITADRPLKIVHQQEQATFTANNGQVDLPSSLATLSGDARGIATRNQAKLRADKLVWEMTSQQLVGTGNVVYQQVRPQIKFTGNRGVGKLQDQSIVISSDRRQQVRTEITPK
jgi:LPS export ABC transporter protein LptC